jgi:hypothetical protein
MAEVLVDIMNKLRTIRDTVPELLTEIIQENKTIIEDMNIAQLQRGQRADGEILPDYSEASVMRYGKPPGPIKLFDTGAFYRGITANVYNNALDMDSTDSKTALLAWRYGEEIVGLQEQNVEVLKEEIIKPGLIEKARKLLLNE